MKSVDLEGSGATGLNPRETIAACKVLYTATPDAPHIHALAATLPLLEPHATRVQTPVASLSAVSATVLADVAASAATAATTSAPEFAIGVVAPLVDTIAHAAPLLGSLGVLTMVIALHEAGHLVAALSQGIRVKSFSIGFGPKLISYRGLSKGEKEAGVTVNGPASILSRLSGPSWDWGAAERRQTVEEGDVAGKKAIGKKVGGKSNARNKGRVKTAISAEGDALEGVEVGLLNATKGRGQW